MKISSKANIDKNNSVIAKSISQVIYLLYSLVSLRGLNIIINAEFMMESMSRFTI